MENYVRLMVLSESASPEQISSQLGMLGDETWRIGDKRKNTAILEKENGWMLHSKREKSTELEDHIDNIRELIRGCESNFKTLSDVTDCEVQLSCSVYYKDEPQLLFEKEIIIWLNSIGASLDLDLYLYRGDRNLATR
ncbi:DUF4279 domain-containing protein [Alkalimonas sp. NCh-2]|uniref:DUF4279 domain-containing protein n=1 Tax=Alkalimonas sp. NCh-2 TaxID=3144846 RepID=UPI0031F6A0A7